MSVPEEEPIFLNPLEIAKIALSYGFVPIALKGKVPVTPQWQKINKKDALKIVEKAIKTKRADNIGILTGQKSNLLVLDIDKGGIDCWNKLLEKHSLPTTFTVLSGSSSSYHYYFRYDVPFGNMSKILNCDIDLRGNGGQVVFPGSVHTQTMQVYSVIDGYDENTGNVIISQMPDWLLKILREHQETH